MFHFVHVAMYVASYPAAIVYVVSDNYVYIFASYLATCFLVIPPPFYIQNLFLILVHKISMFMDDFLIT